MTDIFSSFQVNCDLIAPKYECDDLTRNDFARVTGGGRT